RHGAAVVRHPAERHLTLDQDRPRGARAVAHIHARPHQPAEQRETAGRGPGELVPELDVRSKAQDRGQRAVEPDAQREHVAARHLNHSGVVAVGPEAVSVICIEGQAVAPGGEPQPGIDRKGGAAAAAQPPPKLTRAPRPTPRRPEKTPAPTPPPRAAAPPAPPPPRPEIAPPRHGREPPIPPVA